MSRVVSLDALDILGVTVGGDITAVVVGFSDDILTALVVAEELGFTLVIITEDPVIMENVGYAGEYVELEQGHSSSMQFIRPLPLPLPPEPSIAEPPRAVTRDSSSAKQNVAISPPDSALRNCTADNIMLMRTT